MIASPYAKRNVVNSSYYTQLNMVKTIEQILGVAPMNQEDRAAEPMFNAFTNAADTRAYDVRPNQIPLTYGLASAEATQQSNGTTGSQGRAHQVPRALQQQRRSTSPETAKIQQQWSVWSRHQNFGGATPSEDKANPAQLNRLDWYSSTGWTRPYPGDPKVFGPYQVPGWDKPAAELN